MLGYINDEDLRSKELVKIFKSHKFEITSRVSKSKEADFLYLGVKGIGFEELQYKEKSRVYTLIYSEAIEKRCQQCNAQYAYLYKDFELVKGNTYLTTEAIIGYMVIDNNSSIYNSTVLIIGYGNCGKDIAKKFTALGAKVSIANRGYHHEKNVIKNGFQYYTIENLDVSSYDYVINTVPYQALTKEILATRSEHCKIYDIASYPYGVAKEDRCSNYYILNSLPSKYAYVSAAKLIYKAIIKKEDKYVKK